MRTKLTKCCFLDVSNFCYVHKENLDSLSYQTSTFVQKEIYVVILWKVYENCIFWKSEVIPSSWWLLREKTHKRKEQKLQQKNHNNKRATVRHCPSLHLQFEKVLSVLDKTKSEHEICKSSKVKKRTTLCAPACRLLTIDKKKIPIISSKIWNVLLLLCRFLIRIIWPKSWNPTVVKLSQFAQDGTCSYIFGVRFPQKTITIELCP